MSIFRSERISGHLIRILTPCGVCMYLVQGRTCAALLDTGFGVGDLKGYVDSLVDTPCTVLLSHGHLDHAGGAVQFDRVFLNEQDWALADWHCTLERRLHDVHHGPGGMPEGITDADFLPARTAPYLPLQEGDVFHLGGVTVTPIAVPGHTRGMMVFLIPEDRTAIFGDACGEHTLLLFEHCAPIETYREGLRHLQQYEDQFDVVLRNHGSFQSPRRILADSIELCGDVLARRDAAIPTEFNGEPGLLARPENHPGRAGNMIYSPQQLFAETQACV